jgi:photosynthesis system II assembly factor YCF48-like protein/putative zinc finger protein
MESVPKFVVGRLQGRELDSESHPDVDLLTAFAEQSLDQRERGGVMEHLSHCGNCREILALSMGQEELLPMLGFSSRRKRAAELLAWPVLRWGVLGTAIIAASFVGVRHTRSHSNLNAASRVFRRDPVVDTSSVQDLASRATPPPVSEDKSLAVSIKPQLGEERKSSQQRRAAAKIDSSSNASSLLAMNRRPVAGPAGNDSFDIVKAKDPVPTQAAPGGQIPSPNFPSQISPAMVLRVSPKWAVTTTGTLQRSFDGGKSWEKINPSADAVDQTHSPIFYVVTGTGSEVWVGGATGVLYHSGDSGNHWIRVMPSDGRVGLTGDIISIQFPDPQHGKISTSNAEFWTTSDSAQTWQKQP